MTKSPRSRTKPRKPQFSFRVNPETLRVLELKAQQDDRTLSWLVNHILEQWVAAMLPPHKIRRLEQSGDNTASADPSSSQPGSNQKPPVS